MTLVVPCRKKGFFTAGANSFSRQEWRNLKAVLKWFHGRVSLKCPPVCPRNFKPSEASQGAAAALPWRIVSDNF